MEISIEAAAILFNIDIFVRSRVDNKLQWLKFPVGQNCKISNAFLTLDHTGEHFDILMLDKRPCKCLHCTTSQDTEPTLAGASKLPTTKQSVSTTVKTKINDKPNINSVKTEVLNL